MKQKILLLSILGLVILGAIYFIVSRNQKKVLVKDQLRITASFYPYYFFASQIGGNKTSVINITPAGAEPHDYEPTPQDIVNIESSNLLILNGSVEPWGNKIKDNLKNKNTKILEVGDGLFTQKVVDENGVNSTDPHIWLSPTLAEKQVKAILNEFIQIDPENKTYYYTNTNKLLSDLNNLDKEYRTGLSSCKSRDIITSHAAFGYLATDYGLKQVPIAGLSPDAEPSLKQLTDIANFARKNNIKYIFFESLVSPKLSNTIASDVGAKTLVLNPIEGLTPAELSEGKNYLTVMQDNLQNLKIALQCN